jgi:hypothetical protein
LAVGVVDGLRPGTLVLMNLGDSRVRLQRSREQYAELRTEYDAWSAAGGIYLVANKDPNVMLWEFDVAITREPRTNLSALAGEVLDNVRKPLDYIAWRVYELGTAGRTERLDRQVSFPVVADAEQWTQRLNHQVPGAHPDAAAALRAFQPFAVPPEWKAALPCLSEMVNRDKHRNLHLFAAAVFAQGAYAPEMSDGLAWHICLTLPPPRISIAESLTEIQSRRPADMPNAHMIPTWRLAWVEMVYHGGDDDGQHVPRSAGIEMQDPDPPEMAVGFVTTDGSATVGLPHIGSLIDLVTAIVDRFEALELS